jgi:hypothetical protein
MPGSTASEGSEVADFLDDFGSSSDDGELPGGALDPPVTGPEPEPEPESSGPPLKANLPLELALDRTWLEPLPDTGWPMLQLLYRSGARVSVRPAATSISDARAATHTPTGAPGAAGTAYATT